MRPLRLAALLAALVGCDRGDAPEFAELKNAERVEVFRVGPDPATPGADAIGGFPILATGPDQGPAFAAWLAEIMTGGGVTPNRKKCGLRPGVAFRVWHGGDALEVLVCFECDVLWPHPAGAPVEGMYAELRDFDPVRPELLALAREAFPDDALLRELPARR